VTDNTKSNYLKADLTLGVLTLGFFISYPFHASLAGGLIFSACSAGMIGGLADWFAVNAFFRKPLGIRPGKIIRTEIIPRNRERIYSALVEMVQNDLLHKNNLKIKLSQYDFSQILTEYLNRSETQDKLQKLLVFLIKNTVKHTDPHSFKHILNSLLEECLNSIRFAPYLAEMLKLSLNTNYFEPLADFLFDFAQELVKNPQTNQVLTNLIQQAYNDYEGNNSARKLVATFLPSPADMSGIVQEKLSCLISEPQTQDKLKLNLEHFCMELTTDSVLQEKIELAKSEVIQNQLVQNFLQKYLSDTADYLQNNDQDLVLWLKTLTDNLLFSFENSNTLQKKFDDTVKVKVSNWIDKKHDNIGRAVRNNLDKLDNETLIRLIEDKAGNDLQMIRINGSLVGGLAGLIIYLLTYFIS
jgi:uncharacterized membrane-anchored protein YjiN (DUF445 family)